MNDQIIKKKKKTVLVLVHGQIVFQILLFSACFAWQGFRGHPGKGGQDGPSGTLVSIATIC